MCKIPESEDEKLRARACECEAQASNDDEWNEAKPETDSEDSAEVHSGEVIQITKLIC